MNRLDGTRATAKDAGIDAHFRADLDDAARERFLADWPHRIAFKTAHSKRNPEMDWGEDVLRAVRFPFFQLNARESGGGGDREREAFTNSNTLVIATGSSNGGGAVIYAAEHDTDRLIDGVVAREPQVQLRPDERVTVTRGQTVRRGSGRTLLDYFTFANLYQPCPVLAVPDAPFRDAITFAANRCASFREKGLLTADAVEGQARESLERMRDYGWDQEIGILHAFGYYVAPDATATKYVNDHGRFEVRDRLCGYSYDASFNAVKRFGHVVSCLGWGTHALAPLSFRAATYSGVFTLLPMLTGQGRAHHGEILREAAKLAEAGKVAPILDPHRFQLAQVADAHAAIENRIAAGKIVVDIEF